MSIRGSITVECDRPTCRAEIVLEGEDAKVTLNRHGLALDVSAPGWSVRYDGDIVCPDCAFPPERERDEDDGKSYGHPADAKAERL